jgi:hypothetical protein
VWSACVVCDWSPFNRADQVFNRIRFLFWQLLIRAAELSHVSIETVVAEANADDDASTACLINCFHATDARASPVISIDIRGSSDRTWQRMSVGSTRPPNDLNIGHRDLRCRLAPPPPADKPTF